MRFFYAISIEATMEENSRHTRAIPQICGYPGGYIGGQGSMHFHEIASKDASWLRDYLISYLTNYKTRLFNKEIASYTLRNVCKPIKLFCDMNDILINWRPITRGMPPARKASTDRAPNVHEILRHLKHTHVRIKSIILTILTSWELI